MKRVDPVAIPPSALPQCDAEVEAGGWVLRTFNARGTDVETEHPARTRNLRLGEPCLHEEALAIPGLLTEVESEGDDWASGSGGTDGGGCSGCGGGGGGGGPDDPGGGTGGAPLPHQVCAPAISPVSTVPLSTLKETPVNTNCTAVAYLSGENALTPYGTYLSTANPGPTSATVTTVWDAPMWGDDTKGMVFTTWCWVTGNLESVAQDAAASTVWTSTGPPETTPPMNCNAVGRTPYAIGYTVRIDAPLIVGTSERRFGIFWRADGLTSMDTAGPRLDGAVAPTMTVGTGATDRFICTTAVDGSGAHEIPIDLDYRFDRFNPPEMNDPEAYELTSQQLMDFIEAADCAYVQHIYLTICVWVPPNGPTSFSCFESQWTYTLYRNGHPYGPTTPEEDLCAYSPNPTGGCGPILFPDPNAPEDGITCVISYSDPGNPITSIGDFFVGLPDWAACMVTPEGWDRNNLINRTWTSGNIGEMNDAFASSVPSGIGCGVIATIPMWSGTVSLNTCAVDVAPGFVKEVVGWVMVIGLCFLIIRRIMWSVGSK